MDKKTLKRVRIALGAPVIGIELTEEIIKEMYKESKEEFRIYSKTSNFKNNNIKKLKKAWIFKYTIALCKETMGMIRGKFGGSMDAVGEKINMDYSFLLNQAREEKISLKNIL